jgi:uncharacterized protein YceK
MRWAALLCLLLTGCAESIATYNGYKAAAGGTMQMAMDSRLMTLKFEVCAMPFSAIMRNPEWIDPIKSLCLGGGTTTVEELMEAGKKR